jgi:hypothetical protein
MDATLIRIDCDVELARASAPDRGLRGKQMAAPAAEHRRPDPPPHGSARPLGKRYGPDLGSPQPRERNPAGQEWVEHCDGAALARPVSCAGRIASPAFEKWIGKARGKAGRGLTLRPSSRLQIPAGLTFAIPGAPRHFKDAAFPQAVTANCYCVRPKSEPVCRQVRSHLRCRGKRH